MKEREAAQLEAVRMIEGRRVVEITEIILERHHLQNANKRLRDELLFGRVPHQTVTDRSKGC